MKLSLSKKTLKLTSIYIGVFQLIYYLFEYFAIQYFSSIGLPDKVSCFGLSILLISGGSLLYRNYALGENLILAFIIGTFINKIILYILFPDFIDLYAFGDISVVSSIIIAIIWFYTNGKYSKNYKYFIISLSLALFIVLISKLLPPVF